MEVIMKEDQDMDGVDCYIKKGILVRCRDCVFYWDDLKLCCNEDGLAKASEETYCPYGERRTGGTDGTD